MIPLAWVIPLAVYISAPKRNETITHLCPANSSNPTDSTLEIGKSVASGVYFYIRTLEDFTATRKMSIERWILEFCSWQPPCLYIEIPNNPRVNWKSVFPLPCSFGVYRREATATMAETTYRSSQINAPISLPL